MNSIPKIYRAEIDEFCEATQADVDALQNCRAAFGMWRAGTQALMEVTLAVAQGKKPAFDIANAISKFGKGET